MLKTTKSNFDFNASNKDSYNNTIHKEKKMISLKKNENWWGHKTILRKKKQFSNKYTSKLWEFKLMETVWSRNREVGRT